MHDDWLNILCIISIKSDNLLKFSNIWLFDKIIDNFKGNKSRKISNL